MEVALLFSTFLILKNIKKRNYWLFCEMIKDIDLNFVMQPKVAE